jgi:type I restriction enzyme S subunit
MEEWKTYKIGSLCSISSSKRIFAKEYQSSGIPFYRGKEVIEKQKGETVSTELYISKSRYDEIKNKFGVPEEGDMLLTSVGTLGIPYVVKNETFYFKDGNLTWFSNFKGINSKFLYYWFLSPMAKNAIDAKAIGSTQKALTIDALSKFEIDIPNIETQEKIVSILSSLDSKIELNRRINDNLIPTYYA